MASKKAPSRASLGSFSEDEARAIAESLVRAEAIKATVRRVMVGARDNEPTDWWIVEVPERSALSANAWLRGWRSGNVHHRIERFRESRGGTYAQAAHDLGYLEVFPCAESPCGAALASLKS